MRILMGLILCAYVGTYAHAVELAPDGRFIEKVCGSSSVVDRAYCDGYIAGVLGGRLVYATEKAAETSMPQSIGHCMMGRSVAPAELRALVLSYITRNRSWAESIDAGYAVSRALGEAFPCKK